MSDTGPVMSELAESAAGEQTPCCSTCAQSAGLSATEQFVFAIGKLDVRMPSLGIEREFRRCSRPEAEAAAMPRGERIRAVLEANPHIASRVCYVFSIASTPAFSLRPTTQSCRESLLAALGHIDRPDHWTVAIGLMGPVSRPSDCGGLLVPIVACDQIFSFSVEEWIGDLQQALEGALTTEGEREALSVSARELFDQTISSVQNIGVNDAHRALNFLLMRHPGIFLAAAQRRGKAVLDRVETRLHYGFGTRRQVSVILTFVDVRTGVPERLFCRVDVTEEWPFVADQPNGTPVLLGLMPFVESEMTGVGP